MSVKDVCNGKLMLCLYFIDTADKERPSPTPLTRLIYCSLSPTHPDIMANERKGTKGCNCTLFAKCLQNNNNHYAVTKFSSLPCPIYSIQKSSQICFRRRMWGKLQVRASLKAPQHNYTLDGIPGSTKWGWHELNEIERWAGQHTNLSITWQQLIQICTALRKAALTAHWSLGLG